MKQDNTDNTRPLGRVQSIKLHLVPEDDVKTIELDGVKYVALSDDQLTALCSSRYYV